MEETNARSTKSLAVETASLSSNISQPSLALTEAHNQWEDDDIVPTSVVVFQVFYGLIIWPLMMMILPPIYLLGYAIVRCETLEDKDRKPHR